MHVCRFLSLAAAAVSFVLAPSTSLACGDSYGSFYEAEPLPDCLTYDWTNANLSLDVYETFVIRNGCEAPLTFDASDCPTCELTALEVAPGGEATLELMWPRRTRTDTLSWTAGEHQGEFVVDWVVGGCPSFDERGAFKDCAVSSSDRAPFDVFAMLGLALAAAVRRTRRRST